MSICVVNNMKKEVVFITIADQNNLNYAKLLKNSFRKFHKDIPFEIITGSDLEVYTKDDPMFFYRACPILGEKYLKEYDLVVKIDSDSIVLGDLSYIWKTQDYDIGTVLNYNRYDPSRYGYVQFQGVLPIEYMNCGLVAMRNEKFVHDWKILCFSEQFNRARYKEQDLLNAMIYYGNWNIRCFDHGDGPAKVFAWWGLIGKLEWSRALIKDNMIYVPKGLGETPFPPKDVELKIVHMAGGSPKEQWSKFFSPEIMKRINYLTSEET